MPVPHASSARRILAGAMAFTVAHLAATSLLAQSAGAPTPMAGQLAAAAAIDQARLALDAGRLIAAQNTLRGLLKAEGLSGDRKLQAAELLERADRRIKAADVGDISLQKAEIFLAQGDLVQAERQALAVLGRGTMPATQRDRATGVMKQIQTSREAIKPLVADAVTRAVADFQAGRYAQSKAGLSEITRTGVELSAGERSLVTQHQMRLVEIETTQGFAFEAPATSLGLMQPGTVRREGDPAPAQPTEPAAQPAAPVPAPAAPAAQPEAPAPATAPAPAAAPAGDDVIAMAMKADAERHVVEGDAAFAAGRYNEALNKYRVALDQGRAHLSAEQVQHAENRLAECRTRIGAAAGSANLSQQELERQAIIRDKTKAEYGNEMEQARKALAAGETSRARELSGRARVTSGSSRQYFSQAENDVFSKEIDELNRQITAQEETIRLRDASTREAELKKTAADAERSLREDKDRRVREAISRVRALQVEQKYSEALQVVEQVLFLDPTNPSGLLLRDVIGDIIIFTQQDALYRTKKYNLQKVQIENETASVAPIRIVNYPADWPSKSFTRGELAAYNDSPENRRAMAALERRIPGQFDGQGLGDVVNYIRQMSGAEFDVDWDSLRTAGITPSSPISMSLTDASAKVVLERALAKAARNDTGEKAAYSVLDGIVTVGSELSLRKTTITQPYNITDLLLDTPNFTDVPDMDLRRVIAAADGKPMSNASPFTQKPKNDLRNDRDGRVRGIMGVVQNSIDPDGWRDHGGETSAIQELNGSLIITTTPQNHREIAGLLGKLREQRSMQINVETRFLTVNQDFFEQIGFDIDVYFNTGSSIVRNAQLNDPSILPSDFFDFRQNFNINSAGDATRGPLRRDVTGQVTTAGASPPATADQTRVRQGTVNANQWSPIGTGSNTLGITEGLASGFSPFAADILSGSPALGIAGQFLDDVQVDFLIKATQADRRSSTLTAPRLTLTNGQVSNVYVATQRSFISDLTPVTGQSAVGFDPQPGVLTEGVVMQVEGAISSDRRYVTLNIDTSVSQAERPFRQVAVSAVAGGQLVSSDDVSSFIELPSINTTRVQTTVTVPDEGTVLLGGQRLVTELEVESGVPVLSKIPIINRFFTNRVQSKQEQTLMILIKPTVLIQTEEEERNFPGLSDSMKTGLGG